MSEQNNPAQSGNANGKQIFVLLCAGLIMWLLYSIGGYSWWWYLIIGFVALSIIGSIQQKDQKEKGIATEKEKLAGEGIDPGKMIPVGSYRGGHPRIDKYISNVDAYPMGDHISLYATFVDGENTGKPKFSIEAIGQIPKNAVKNIQIEDATTVEKRLSVGKILMFGPAGFAMKKKEVTPSAFVTIEWNDGRFDHQTIFQTSNMEQANKARNSLIREIQNN